MQPLNHNIMGQGPDIVLLHGWGFHSGVWEPFLPLLSQDFRVTTIDLPGYGNSAAFNETLTLECLANSVLEVTPDKAIYLGWSLGGLVAMQIALYHSDRIEQLITIASTPKFLVEKEWPGMLSNVLSQFANALKEDPISLFKEFILLQFQESDTDRSVVKRLRQHIANGPMPDLKTLSDSLSILKNTDLRNELKKIQCPQLYIYGRKDMIVPVNVAEKIRSISPNAKITVIPKAGHAPFLSHGQICFDTIKEFLKP